MIALLAVLMLQSAAADPIGDLIASQAPAAGAFDEWEELSGDISSNVAFMPECRGTRIQGAVLICTLPPEATVTLGDVTATANPAGYAIVGIPRSAAQTLSFAITMNARGSADLVEEQWDITQREYNIQTVTGVPQRTVTPDPSTLPRRQREYAQKQAAFNSTWDGQGFLDGFIAPAEGITTGVYGSQRVYNGTPGNPHWGLDWANDVGTPIVSPAGGLVTLAEADMFYEGGLIFIDHGQGLVSAFLHMSAVHVSEGDIVTQGQLIGDIGAGGRATGPHLDWRVKLRNGFYVDPALLMELDLSGLRDAE